MTDRAVGWKSPSNIALVKYWGKRKGQIPENSSVSITLKESFTGTFLHFSPSGNRKGELKSFSFGGKEEASFSSRIGSYLESVRTLYPFLVDYDLRIESSNSFPHSSGIASSASAMSALALCLTSMERVLFDSPSDDESFFRKASYAARIGSGSAARSVYPGYVLWGKVPEVPQSENEFAVPLGYMVHDELKDIHDAILIVDESPKPVSSSRGHALMESNPWARVRYEQAARNTSRLLEVISSGDLEEFVKLTEAEALTLHSLMMSSEDGYLLMKPGTLEIIEKVRTWRKRTNIPAAFTMDAGPNVHLIYPGRYREKVINFVEEELLQHCSKGRWIDDSSGPGPVQINKVDG